MHGKIEHGAGSIQIKVKHGGACKVKWLQIYKEKSGNLETQFKKEISIEFR